MANPKITLSIDQECMDILNKAVDALSRFCDSCAALQQPIRAYPENTESEMKAIDLGAGTVEVIPAAEATADVVAPAAPVAPDPVIPNPVPFQFQMPAAAAPAQPAVPQMPTMQFTTPAAPTAPAAPQMPTSAPAFTMEQLGRAGLELSQHGVNVAAIMASEFQVMSLDHLPVEQYPAFAARLRQLGANI